MTKVKTSRKYLEQRKMDNGKEEIINSTKITLYVITPSPTTLEGRSRCFHAKQPCSFLPIVTYLHTPKEQELIINERKIQLTRKKENDFKGVLPPLLWNQQ